LDVGFGEIDHDPVGIAYGEDPVLDLFRKEGDIAGMLGVAADLGLQRHVPRGRKLRRRQKKRREGESS
jgi:hypothetical protein